MEINIKTDGFSTYHPFVIFMYFVAVLGFTMVFMHPLCLIISFFSAVIYSVELKGIKSLKFTFAFLLPMIAITALINPAFNHEGATILMYLFNGNPLTLESIIYGLGAGLMLGGVICWFSCCNHVFTSDKFIYIFGRVIPSMSLIFSMVLRFVPRFKAQLKIVTNAQKCIGRDVSQGGVFVRIKNGIAILSIMLTWSLENAVETADSMKSRGYGLSGRTAFSIYKITKRDIVAMAVIIFIAVYILVGSYFGGLYFRYFPTVKMTDLNFFSISLFGAYIFLCILPVIINKEEVHRWKSTQSAI